MKRMFALVMAMVMTLALVACGGGDKLTFTTGGESGTYYGFGTVLAGQISDKTDTTVTAIVGAGSKGNIEAMDVGDAQLGFVQSDVMAYAYEGVSLFDKKIESFSTVAALYMEQVQIVTLDPTIKTVADLKGKNVSVGASGSGVYFNAIDVLSAYDLTLDDIKPTYQSFGDSPRPCRTARSMPPSSSPVLPPPPSLLWPPTATFIWLSWTTSTSPSCRRLLPTTART